MKRGVKMKKVVNSKKLKLSTKELDFKDIALTKLAVASGILFLITAFRGFLFTVLKIHWIWYLIAMFVFAIRPLKHFYKNKKK